MSEQIAVAYFSMEIALDPGVPTYSGGLGVLAGDTIKSAADLKIPMTAVTLLHRKGYFQQRFDEQGNQIESPVEWNADEFLREMSSRTLVEIEGRKVHLRSWRYEVKGISGFVVPVYFLDADLPENSDWDRRLTDHLYGGDKFYRLCQEVILGIGGVRMLRDLGYENIKCFHMNEGHSSLLTLELLAEDFGNDGIAITKEDIRAVREMCIFTTHTPVPAGHDQFPLAMLKQIIGSESVIFDFNADSDFNMSKLFREDMLNMTYLGLNLSRYVNGVAKKHGEISRLMFAGYEIDAITNGVHAATWTSEPFQELFDRYVPGWREDGFSLRSALSIPRQEIWSAHIRAKKSLFEYVRSETGIEMDENVLTLGFARRATAYKRADLIFTDIGWFKSIASKAGPIQLIFAGKAHPMDQSGKDLIRQIFNFGVELKEHINLVYLSDYGLELGKLMTSGVDVWLNTPLPPNEASGTSGMKAALNGVPSLSILDGWWIEGNIEGVTGWSIGDGRAADDPPDRSKDAASLYEKLEHIVCPLFYQARPNFIDVMRHAVALNGSFFNTHRMMQQYVLNAYFL